MLAIPVGWVPWGDRHGRRRFCLVTSVTRDRLTDAVIFHRSGVGAGAEAGSLKNIVTLNFMSHPSLISIFAGSLQSLSASPKNKTRVQVWLYEDTR